MMSAHMIPMSYFDCKRVYIQLGLALLIPCINTDGVIYCDLQCPCLLKNRQPGEDWTEEAMSCTSIFSIDH